MLSLKIPLEMPSTEGFTTPALPAPLLVARPVLLRRSQALLHHPSGPSACPLPRHRRSRQVHRVHHRDCHPHSSCSSTQPGRKGRPHSGPGEEGRGGAASFSSFSSHKCVESRDEKGELTSPQQHRHSHRSLQQPPRSERGSADRNEKASELASDPTEAREARVALSEPARGLTGAADGMAIG